jgi:hypothetical protein
MDSCLCHTYTNKYAFFEISSRGFSGSMALNSWGMCQTKPEIFFGIFFLADYACIWGGSFFPEKKYSLENHFINVQNLSLDHF